MQDDPDRKPLLDMLPDGRFRVLRGPDGLRGGQRGAYEHRVGLPLGSGLAAGAALAATAALLAVLATFLAALVPIALVAVLLGRATVRVRRDRA